MTTQPTGRDRRWLAATAVFSILAILGLVLTSRDSSPPDEAVEPATTTQTSLPESEPLETPSDPEVLGSTTTTFSDNDPTTLYVSPSGNDANSGQSPEVPFGTLETAIARTQPGMTLYVMDGTHRITSPGPTQIAFRRDGRPDAWTRITAAPGASPVIVATEGTALEPSGSYIEVSGLTIRGETFDVEKNYGVGILVADGHHFLVDRNTVSGFATGGIAAVRASHLTFSNNVVFENSKWGPQQGSGLSSWIGTDYGYPDDANGYSDYFVGNVIYRNENLVPSQWIQGGVITDGNGIIVDMNIDSGYSGRTLIANNIIVDNGGRAITVYKSQRVDVVNNSTFGNGKTGPTLIGGNSEMNVLDSADVRAWNNLLWNDGSTPALWVGRSSNVEAFNNALVGGTTMGIDVGTNLVIESNPGVAAPNPSTRPSDFELTAGSPLIDAGAPVPTVVSTDFFDRPRPAEGSIDVDIGALESGGQTPNPLPRQDPDPDPAPEEDAAPQETPGPRQQSTEQAMVQDDPITTAPPEASFPTEPDSSTAKAQTGPMPQADTTGDKTQPPEPEPDGGQHAAMSKRSSADASNVGSSDDLDPQHREDADPEISEDASPLTPTTPWPADPSTPGESVSPAPDTTAPGTAEAISSEETASFDLVSPPVATLAFIDSDTATRTNALVVPTAGFAAALCGVAVGLRALRPRPR